MIRDLCDERGVLQGRSRGRRTSRSRRMRGSSAVWRSRPGEPSPRSATRSPRSMKHAQRERTNLRPALPHLCPQASTRVHRCPPERRGEPARHAELPGHFAPRRRSRRPDSNRGPLHYEALPLPMPEIAYLQGLSTRAAASPARLCRIRAVVRGATWDGFRPGGRWRPHPEATRLESSRSASG
jgi:hypothetical protein